MKSHIDLALKFRCCIVQEGKIEVDLTSEWPSSDAIPVAGAGPSQEGLIGLTRSRNINDEIGIDSNVHMGGRHNCLIMTFYLMKKGSDLNFNNSIGGQTRLNYFLLNRIMGQM